jgi:hypothetical protein
LGALYCFARHVCSSAEKHTLILAVPKFVKEFLAEGARGLSEAKEFA